MPVWCYVCLYYAAAVAVGARRVTTQRVCPGAAKVTDISIQKQPQGKVGEFPLLAGMAGGAGSKGPSSGGLPPGLSTHPALGKEGPLSRSKWKGQIRQKEGLFFPLMTVTTLTERPGCARGPWVTPSPLCEIQEEQFTKLEQKW